MGLLHGGRDEIAALRGEVTRLREQLAAAEEARRVQLAAAEEARREEIVRLREMLQLIHDDEPGNRRRLYALRASPDYESAWTDPEPLVSVVIPTYTSFETLRDRAIPSALAQDYQNIEVVVVGDAAPPETAEAIASIGDERVRYVNRPVRGPYPDDRKKAWYASGSPPYNEAAQLARGRWIAGTADDDALRSDCVSTLLETARAGRYEFVYSKLLCLMNDGSSFVFGDFPPQLGQFGSQGSMYHAGLRFVEMELADCVFEIPNDWSLGRRMLRLGVRFGMADRVLVDHWESKFSVSVDEP